MISLFTVLVRPLGRFMTMMAFGAFALFAAAAAQADEAAETYVRSVLQEANAIFGESDEAERMTGIKTLVDKHVDMRRVGLFVLGQYARQISETQKKEYLPLFKKYATLVYQDSLSNYSGQRLGVTDSIDRTERDIIVNSKIIDAKPGDQYSDLVVHWRIYRDNSGEMSVFDAGAEGVWLAIEQQSQFKSVIANNGGGSKGIDALISQLKDQVGG